jgi:hypothetical protein
MDEINSFGFREKMKKKTNKANTKKCCNFAENLQEL